MRYVVIGGGVIVKKEMPVFLVIKTVKPMNLNTQSQQATFQHVSMASPVNGLQKVPVAIFTRT